MFSRQSQQKHDGGLSVSGVNYYFMVSVLWAKGFVSVSSLLSEGFLTKLAVFFALRTIFLQMCLMILSSERHLIISFWWWLRH
jgi:hypothetical protein